MNYEQKPEVLEWARRHWLEASDIEKKNWEFVFPELQESEDERIRKKIIDIVKAAPFDEEKDVLLSWLEKQKEQEHICDSVKFEEGYKTGYEVGLRDKKEQKPAEWSEEDERIRKAILGFVNPDKGGTKYSSYAELVEWSNWLKSLKPQPKRNCKDCAMFLGGKCIKPSWKPSEEQMNELWATLIPEYEFDCDILKGLYYDLKKLMEDKQ